MARLGSSSVIQRKLGHCCICFRLSYGMGLLAVFFFLLGVYNFLSLFLDDPRLQWNGAYYKPLSKLEPLVGTGFIGAALLGFVGVLDERASFVQVFLYYMQLHLAAYCLVFLMDVWTLGADCKTAHAGKTTAARNLSLDILRTRGTCDDALTAFGVGSLVSLSIRLYWLYTLRKYWQKLSTKIPHLIAFEANYVEGIEIDIDENPGDFLQSSQQMTSYEANILGDMQRMESEWAAKALKEYGTIKSEKYGPNG
ncbi:unnamed protein product [Amoebophrya sp. A25]|nr:unnamed protein product [Amoebophrya sp. A25]|eukprot:GSA25T00006557001.1